MAREWWRRLAAPERREYERSESIARLALPHDPSFEPLVLRIEQALAQDDRAGTERAAQALVDRLCGHLEVPVANVSVLGKRPADGSGELHGIYRGGTGGGAADSITVWMRTAKRKDVVAPRTFLRTLLHEVAHHLDVRALDLPNSFHSKGFYQRESSLMRAITRGTRLAPRGGPRRETSAATAPAPPPPADAEGVRRGLEILRNVAEAIAARTRR